MAYLIALGSAKLRHWWHYPEFAWRTSASLRQAKSAEGCLHAEVFPYRGHFCSFTAWESPALMKAYATGGAHKGALKMGRLLTESSGFFHFWHEGLPDHNMVLRQLDAYHAHSGLDQEQPHQIQVAKPKEAP